MATDSSTKSHVTQTHDGQLFHMDLTASTCSCNRYQDTGVAIDHHKAKSSIRQHAYDDARFGVLFM